MKKTILHTLSYLFALGICLFPAMLFGRVLLVYTVPMRDDSYNLSLYWEGEAIPEGWQYDQKGWTVFTQEEKQKTLLAADGMGGFTGLQKPGQTFYFSRTLSETLDSPTLRLDTANQSIAVFLTGNCSIPTARSWITALVISPCRRWTGTGRNRRRFPSR